MSIKDLPKSLIDAASNVVETSEAARKRLTEKVLSEAMKKFDVASLANLSTAERRVLNAWIQVEVDRRWSLRENACHCSDVAEDDMPGDVVFHQGGNEGAPKKKEIDEQDRADKDHDGDGEIESGEDEYLGSRDKAIKKAMANEEDDSLTESKYKVYVNGELKSTHSSEADANQAVKNLKSSLKTATREPFAKDRANKVSDYEFKIVKEYIEDSEEVSEDDEVDLDKLSEESSSDMDWECVDCDRMGRRDSDSKQDKPHREMRNKEFLGLKRLPFLSREQKRRLEVLKSLRVKDNKFAMNESVAIDPHDLATNGAVGVTDANAQMPVHVDVLRDTSPVDGKTEYRLFVQKNTNELPQIIPPPSLPGAPTLDELLSLIEGLPLDIDVLENAIAVAKEAEEAAAAAAAE